MNVLTSSQSYSWHQVLFMYVQLQSFLILLDTYFPRGCCEALYGLKLTSSRLSLAGPCLMFVPWTFCLPLWFFCIDTGHWMPCTVFCDHICETQKIQEFTYCTTKLWSLGDKTQWIDSSFCPLLGGLSRYSINKTFRGQLNEIYFMDSSSIIHPHIVSCFLPQFPFP